ncbi:MAG: hypothetical protein LBR60_01445 [Fibrobacter sp.]|jgi:HlyD family secretion protein|nr:hypothetical protein [Fibrobacter sp.]
MVIFRNKFLFAWILAVAAIVTFGYLFRGETIIFAGVAEASETVVSVQTAVEIVKVHVIPGQEVKNGDTLVELSRSDLAVRMNEVARELDIIEGRTHVSSASIDQRVAEVQADLATRKNALVFEINRLKSEYRHNQEITSKLSSLPKAAPADSNNAMVMRIRNLEQELRMVEENARSQIRLLQGSKGLQKTSNASEAEALLRELEMLKKEQEELVVTAKEDWVVGAVNVRDGERASSFFPLLTLTKKAPSMIRGYVHETVYNQIQVGANVDVISSQAGGHRYQGVVTGMSSRIVEFPIRLRKVPEFMIYGREVIIRIPEKNDLLLGEKVSISEVPEWKKLLNYEATENPQ